MDKSSTSHTTRLFAPDAYPLGGGRVLPDAQWQISTHHHPSWEFIYFLRGGGRVHLPEAELRPREFHLVAYPPEVYHAERSDPYDPEETIFISIEAGTPPPGTTARMLYDASGDLGWLCQHILEECACHGLGSPLAKAYTTAFLVLVERAWEGGTPLRDDPVTRAIRYIESQYPSEITLRDIARAAQISTSHLAHIFRTRMGISPLRYLMEVRINAARRLLAAGDLPVREVAERIGFQDPLYFSRVFRRHVGVAPSHFRDLS